MRAEPVHRPWSEASSVDCTDRFHGGDSGRGDRLAAPLTYRRLAHRGRPSMRIFGRRSPTTPQSTRHHSTPARVACVCSSVWCTAQCAKARTNSFEVRRHRLTCAFPNEKAVTSFFVVWLISPTRARMPFSSCAVMCVCVCVTMHDAGPSRTSCGRRILHGGK